MTTANPHIEIDGGVPRKRLTSFERHRRLSARPQTVSAPSYRAMPSDS